MYAGQYALIKSIIKTSKEEKVRDYLWTILAKKLLSYKEWERIINDPKHLKEDKNGTPR